MQVVSILNMKGGVAKTTLAINLAHSLVTREEKRVLVIDLDPQFNATQCLIEGSDYVARIKAGGKTIVDIFDDRPPPSISVISGAKASASTALKDIKPWTFQENFDLVPGDLELYRLDMGGGTGREQRLKRYLEEIKARDNYDLIIIDTPPTPSHWMMSALLASDGYLVPVKADPLSRTGIDLLRNVVDRCSQNFGHPIECVGVVLTMAEAQTVVLRETQQFLDDNPTWKGKRFQSYLPKRIAVAAAQSDQRLILDLPDSALKLALTNITQEFLGRISHD